MAKAKRETYHVRLVRPRFEVQYLTVEATDDEEAKALAFFAAGDDAEDWKLIDFSSDDYHPYVERCESENDLAANELTPEEAEELFSSTDRPEYEKYFLLYADTASGEGEICEQPWLWAQGALLISDVGGDWMLGLQEIMENEASEDAVKHELLGGDPSAATKALLAETLRKRPKKGEPPNSK